MALLDKLRSLVGAEPDRTFTYKCSECETVFESPEPSRARAACPECGADRIQSAPNQTPTTAA